MFDEACYQEMMETYLNIYIIQPWTFIRKNGLNPFQANVIKYERYLFKGKSIEKKNKTLL